MNMSLTTATNTDSKVERKADITTNRVTQILTVICAGVWIWSGIDPKFPADWFLENILVAVGVILFIWIYRTRPLSDVSHILLAIFFCMHVAASHYTYSETPWGNWAKEAFDMQRNHYDRVVHFSFGLLLAYPVREFLVRYLKMKNVASFFFAFTILVACSEIYEIIEWMVATIVDPDAGNAFLGTQGDEFDAQKDTSLALLGTVITLSITHLIERSKQR
jgi:putative membrane protein